MNKYDWKNAFPKPSENFHNKLCMTLDSLEKENVKMKKISLKKSIIIAAAVLALSLIHIYVAVVSKDTAALKDWYMEMYGGRVVYDNGKGTYFLQFADGSMIAVSYTHLELQEWQTVLIEEELRLLCQSVTLSLTRKKTETSL